MEAKEVFYAPLCFSFLAGLSLLSADFFSSFRMRLCSFSFNLSSSFRIRVRCSFSCVLDRSRDFSEIMPGHTFFEKCSVVCTKWAMGMLCGIL